MISERTQHELQAIDGVYRQNTAVKSKSVTLILGRDGTIPMVILVNRIIMVFGINLY